MVGQSYLLLSLLVVLAKPTIIFALSSSSELFRDVLKQLFAENRSSSSPTQSLSSSFIEEIASTFPPESFHSLGSLDRFDILPPLWNEVKVLNTDNYPIADDYVGSLEVDVWDYTQRMSLYKYMIQNFHHCEFDALEKRLSTITDGTAASPQLPKPDLVTDKESVAHVGAVERDVDIPIQLLDIVDGLASEGLNPWSIVWGLPLQHGWQFSSGRLGAANGSTTMDSQAWWADMNYYLSVVPYFGAVAAGLAPPIVLKSNPDPQRLCNAAADCPDVVAPWTAFFQQLNSTADSCTEDYSAAGSAQLTNTPIADALDFNLTTGLESLLFSLWAAHLNSIGYALPLFEDHLNLLPGPEQQFSRAWAGIVDFIAECNFKCDLLTTDVLQNLLPNRVLQDRDQIPFVEDLSRLQNRAVFLIDGLYALNATSGGRVEAAWNCSMCTEAGRAYGREMITLGVYRPVVAIEDLLPLSEIVKEQSLEECPACGGVHFAGPLW